MQASTIILIEHRSLDAVIHGMLYLVQHVWLGAKPHFEILSAMVDYIASLGWWKRSGKASTSPVHARRRPPREASSVRYGIYSQLG